MKRKVLAWLVTLAMAITMIPGFAFAGEAGSDAEDQNAGLKGYYDEDDDDYYWYDNFSGIKVNGTLIFDGETWEVDNCVSGATYEDGVLTLENYVGGPVEIRYVDSDICIKGENTITGECGIDVTNDKEELTIYGDGSLNIIGASKDEDSLGIGNYGALTISGVKLNIVAEEGISVTEGKVYFEECLVDIDARDCAVQADNGISFINTLAEGGYYAVKIPYEGYVLGVTGAKIIYDEKNETVIYNDKIAKKVRIRQITPEDETVLLNDNLTIYMGQSFQNQLINPRGPVTWSISKTDSLKASVSTTGLIKGKKPGTVTIKAKCAGETYVCTVKILKPCLDAKTLEIMKDEKGKLTVIGGTGKTTWITSNKSIAKVSSSGYVTPVKAGTCTITAKRNGYDLKATVRVVNVPALSKHKLVLRNDEEYQLKVSGGYGDISWSSDNPDLVTVTEDGLVKNISKVDYGYGEKVTVSAARNDRIDECTVYLEDKGVFTDDKGQPFLTKDITFGDKVNIGRYNGKSEVYLRFVPKYTGYVYINSLNFCADAELYDYMHHPLVTYYTRLQNYTDSYTKFRGMYYPVKKDMAYYIKLNEFYGQNMSGAYDDEEYDQTCYVKFTNSSVTDVSGKTEYAAKLMSRNKTYKGLLFNYDRRGDDGYPDDPFMHEDHDQGIYKIKRSSATDTYVYVSTKTCYHMAVVIRKGEQYVTGKTIEIADKSKTLKIPKKWGKGTFTVTVTLDGRGSVCGSYSIRYK